jgi:hypothetical protein
MSPTKLVGNLRIPRIIPVVERFFKDEQPPTGKEYFANSGHVRQPPQRHKMEYVTVIPKCSTKFSSQSSKKRGSVTEKIRRKP